MLATSLPLPPYWLGLSWLLQSLLLVMYQPALAWWSSLLFALLLAFQALRLTRDGAALSNKQINLLLAPILLLMLLQVRQLGVLNVMLHILLLAAIARSATVVKRSDAIQLVWVQYFAIACCFIFYQQISLALLIFSLLALNLYLQHRLFADAATRLAPKRVLRTVLFTLPLWLGLFVLFPRLPPLWQLPNQNMASTGLSDNLDPGSIEELVQSDALAFRVSFQSDRPNRAQWYWRAKVYEDFDGRSWQVNSRFGSRQSTNAPALQNPTSTATVVQYQVLAEKSYQTDLFSLGIPQSWSAPLRAKPAGLLAHPTPLTQRMSYTVQSQLAAVPLASLTEQQLNLVQHHANPETRAFGAELARQYGDNADAIVQALSQYFNQQPYFYTLTPPRLGTNAIDQFLFDTRSGFCSHYASATAVILRAAGIPARVIGGYQGGDWQENQQYLLVRQRDAHAWVEYLTATGWQRFDPTAVIAPDRILAGLEQTLTDAERALLGGWQDNWLGQLALQWSHLDYMWSVWVLGFNQQQQDKLWQRLKQWPYWSWLAVVLFALSLLIAGFLLWHWQRNRQPAKLLAYTWLVKAFGQAPVEGMTMRHYLAQLANQYPKEQTLLTQISALYERAVFAEEQQALLQLKQLLQKERRPLARLSRQLRRA